MMNKSVKFWLLTAAISFSFSLKAQLTAPRAVSQLVSNAKASQVTFRTIPALLIRNTEAFNFNASSASVLNEATFAKIDLSLTNQLSRDRSEAIELTIPYQGGRSITLELVKQDIFAENFYVETSESGGKPVSYTPGVYYRGTIKDQPNSLAAISIFADELFGIVSSDAYGNINIGRYHGANAADNDYVVFSDRDFLANPGTSCATVDDEAYLPQLLQNLNTPTSTRTINVPRVYLEADFGLEQNKGSVTNTANFLTAIFNNSSTIYANDLINISLQEIFVWTSNDGYSTASSVAALNSFKAFRTLFNGDIAQLCALDPGGLGGVAATINGLCNSNKYCYSDIDATYSSFPTYSWTVEVFTHEMGHLFGSYHTHNCGWPGGAIDNCYTTEGGCSPGPAPVGGGTIMSYCHLTAYGINFNNGFGALPGQAIRNTINAAPCLGGGGGGVTYCISNGLHTSMEWIDKVVIGTINRSSASDGGYYDGTALGTNIKIGIPKTLKVSAAFSGSPRTEFWRVWIDYNHDGDFTDIGEQVFSTSSSSAGTLSAGITAPASALSGTTRMRVSMKFGSYPSPCEVFSMGEVEDYSVTITAALPESMIAETSPEVNISPNPSKGIFRLEYTNATSAGIGVSIYDLTGNILSQITSPDSDGSIFLDLTKFPAGLYFVKITTANGMREVKEIVKQ